MSALRVMEIHIVQKSVFPRPLPLSVLLGEDLQYGCYEGMHLTPGKTNKYGFTAFLPQAIGRGIRVRWQDGEEKEVTITLPLPTSDEEIAAFLGMVLRTARHWTCSLFLNGDPVTTHRIIDMEEDVQILNLRILHEMMLPMLTAEDQVLSFSCAMHRISCGKKEAESFWSGTTPNAFRDWMHALQSQVCFIAEAELFADDDAHTGVLTVPSNVPVVLPLQPEVPLPYYDLNNGTAEIQVNRWYARLYSSAEGRAVGMIPYNLFLSRLEGLNTSYYDASDFRLEALSEEDLYRLSEGGLL